MKRLLHLANLQPHNMSLLDELEADFNALRPYHPLPNDNSNKYSHSNEYVSLNSWYETTKQLNSSMPNLPASRIGFPAVDMSSSIQHLDTHAHSRPTTQSQSARQAITSANVSRAPSRDVRSSGGLATTPHLSHSHLPLSSKPSELNVSGKQSSAGQVTEENHFVKVDMVSMCNQGWNLSHGWFNRPKAVQIKDDVVNSNIQRWAGRLEGHRQKQESLKDAKSVDKLLQRTNILKVHSRSSAEQEQNYDYNDETGNAITSRPRTQATERGIEFDGEELSIDQQQAGRGLSARVKGKPYSTPGPKYNLRPSPGKDRLLQKHLSINHATESTVRDIRFGTPGERFQYQSKDVVPLADSSRPPPTPSEAQFMHFFSTKRRVVGSIYEIPVSVPGPGVGKYNTLNAFEKTSGIVPIQGTNFSPVRSTPKEMIEKHERQKFPRYKPPKPLW